MADDTLRAAADRVCVSLDMFGSITAGDPAAQDLRAALRAALAAAETPGPFEVCCGDATGMPIGGHYDGCPRAAAETPGLDVERLARAICNGEASRAPGSPRYDHFSEEAKDLFRREARDLAREYAALPSTDTESDYQDRVDHGEFAIEEHPDGR